ncbi:16S rRNA (cytosine(1402)-N(4))-methyltransferase [Candidatus Kaiserbacteria bacterium RIFCSPHIGHO2_02_FULL_49_34]|uniref:Ribosomal RNA small subunit methyltransferase H n=1 Tax=Candidatus Kaiserbacteria bacterium RIFCSPHIGHO2_02_FULL_49_34 TaxID=1798491 RepID=A0A1F6DL41_9BACT|nr:MAG: 16S rRNA (cytosine(1402)-N(4))-methyltransferase [Candidatus Kaiserbacteria bacterium RIFCSPHIGHO2_02_FULL_49_34]
MHDTKHITVLLQEAVDALDVQPNEVIVDATLGSAGHSLLIAERLGKAGTLIALDADEKAIAQAREKFMKVAPNVRLWNANFRELGPLLEQIGYDTVDGILADLGWRQEQFGGDVEQGGGKGFSFRVDEPLHMTFGDPESYPFTAYDIANSWEPESIATILQNYAEERHAMRIARAIVAARENGTIATSGQLSSIIEESVPAAYRHSGIHPSTRTFQAMRIAVNDELGVLETFIEAALEKLAPNGRLAIITFHSLEDRIVKHAFRKAAADGKGEVVTKKPIIPSDEEVTKNPRARSAKLRVFLKAFND